MQYAAIIAGFQTCCKIFMRVQYIAALQPMTAFHGVMRYNDVIVYSLSRSLIMYVDFCTLLIKMSLRKLLDSDVEILIN